MGKYGRSESVVFNGRTYRRYPDAKHRTTRVYFARAVKRGGVARPELLHRAIWESVNGPIPDGHHIHHKDGNPLNNEISNLECITRSDHLREHASAPERVARSRASLGAARIAAAKWHGSDEGRAWHAEHGRNVMAARPLVPCTCEQCGARFKSKDKNAKLCSGKCRAAKRRDSGLDNELRACTECFAPFSCSRFSKQTCCSRSCGIRKGNRTRRGDV